MPAALVLASIVLGAMPHQPIFLSETATVLAFSDDGTQALVEEHVVGDDGGYLLRYVVLGASGRELTVDASDVVGTARVVQERIDRRACRAAADKLEAALEGFHDVRMRASGCASLPPSRDLVATYHTVPSPLPLGSDQQELQEEVGGPPGVYFVNDRGPLVVVITSAPGVISGSVVGERTFLRKDPRVNQRWPNP